jgi:hypothetical protein
MFSSFRNRTQRDRVRATDPGRKIDLCCATFGEDKDKWAPAQFKVTVREPGAIRPLGEAKVLLDTGTTTRNYVSRDFILNHETLEERLLDIAPRRVRLANGGLVCAYQSILLSLCFPGRAECFSAKFYVLDQLAIDFIIGFYDTAVHFSDMLVDVMTKYAETLEEKEEKEEEESEVV